MQKMQNTTGQYYGYTTSDNCVPNHPFHGVSVMIDFSEASAGDSYIICVMIDDNDCTVMNPVTFIGEDAVVNL